MALAQNGPTLPANVIVEFRQTLAGVPTSTVLASALINGNLLAGVQPGAPVMLTADFSGDGIRLVAGAVYAFSLRIGGQGVADACGSGASTLPIPMLEVPCLIPLIPVPLGPCSRFMI